MRINIIGGGLAGCAIAYILKKRGAEPVIYEASSDIANITSGNEVGVYNPRFAAQMDAHSTYYSEGFFEAYKVFEEFGNAVNWTPCGVISLMNTERKQVRFRKTVASWGWGKDDMRIVSAREATDISGLNIDCEGIYIPKAGNVSPKKLCHEYVKDIEVHLRHEVSDIAALGGDASILACGLGALYFDAASFLPLNGVRGQVSYIEQNNMTKNLRTVLSYGGYLAPAKNEVHCLGATFQPWLAHDGLIPDDNLTNLDKLFDALPYLKNPYNVVASRAGVRVTSRDHFPIVGQLGEGLYISTAHGSHGIISSIKAAKILSDMLLGGEDKATSEVLKALSPDRFGF